MRSRSTFLIMLPETLLLTWIKYKMAAMTGPPLSAGWKKINSHPPCCWPWTWNICQWIENMDTQEYVRLDISWIGTWFGETSAETFWWVIIPWNDLQYVCCHVEWQTKNARETWISHQALSLQYYHWRDLSNYFHSVTVIVNRIA